MHTGEASLDEGRYVGLAVHRAARISAAGHGGQILLSSSTRDVVEDDLPPDQRLVDLGEHRLKDLPRPERVFQLVAQGLQRDFPPLKTLAPAPFEGQERELTEAVARRLPRGWQHPRRRTFIAATAVAAAIGVAVGVLATQGGGSQARASVSGNAVGVIDPDGDIASEVAVGDSPSGVAVAPDAVWVTNGIDDTVSRIDTSTGEVRQTIEVGDGPAGIAVGGGAVWVANGLDATVSRIDPSENKEVQKITVGNGPTGVAFGNGAVWVANSVDGTVARIAPGPGRVTGTFPAVVGASAIAVGFDRVWVTSPTTATVVALDPESGRVVARVGVGVEPDAVAVGDDAVWVANRADGTVSKIDPRVEAVTGSVQVGRGPEGVAAGANAVWVANSRDGTLSRIDPAARPLRVVKVVEVANPPKDVALSDAGVYVVVRSTGDEHRGGQLRVVATNPPESIDPALAYDTTSWGGALMLTNDGLVTFRKVAGVEGTQLVPDLAVAVPAPADGGKTYTFELRPGIHYSTGALVEPRDFRRALERVFELGSPGAGYYSGIVGAGSCRKGKRCSLGRGIVADSASNTVTFHLTGPDGEFTSKLALPFAYAVPVATGPREIRQPLPATGPYRLASATKKALRLVRNSRFTEWSPDAQPDGFPDSILITWPVSPLDPMGRVRAVEKGNADVTIGGGPPLANKQLDDLAVRYPSRLHLTPELSTIYYFLSARVRPFSDPRAREAVRIAWDRDAVGRAVGRGGSPTCRIFPRNYPGYRATCPTAPGGVSTLDRARRLVKASGTQGTSVTVWEPTGAPRPVGAYAVSLLDSLGYRARLRLVTGVAEYFNTVADPRTRVQAGWGGWTLDFPSPDGFMRPLVSCAGYVPTSPETTTNVSGFCSRSVDELMSRATAAEIHDPAAAIALWQRAEDAVLALGPIIPAYNRTYVSLASARVGNYQYNPQWGILFSQLWVK
jgi:YVTN family beta-propeller protein